MRMEFSPPSTLERPRGGKSHPAVVEELRMTDSYELIRRAILNKEQVVAMYGGHLRMMCPHKLGTKTGVAHGLFYQFGGTSETGLEPSGSPPELAVPTDRRAVRRPHREGAVALGAALTGGPSPQLHRHARRDGRVGVHRRRSARTGGLAAGRLHGQAALE